MNRLLLVVLTAALFLLPSSAFAQYGWTSTLPTYPIYPSVYTPFIYTPLPVYTPPRIYTPPVIATPRSGTTTDITSGNTYTWHRSTTGTTDVNGMNPYTASIWQTTIKPDGSMHGIDKDFHVWTYDARSGIYLNSNGTTCVGTGLARTCF